MFGIIKIKLFLLNKQINKFVIWQHALAGLNRNALKPKKGSVWFKLNDRLVSPCYKITSVVLELDLYVSFASLTLNFLALSVGFHLEHLPGSRKYQLRVQKLENQSVFTMSNPILPIVQE